MDKEEFAKRLIMLRKEKNKYQKEVCDEMPISYPSLNAYENAKYYPTVEVLYLLAEYYGVSIDFLCGRTSFRGIRTCVCSK